MPCTLTNSSYRSNRTDFQFTQYHPQTFNTKTCQKLPPTSNMVGVMVRSIFMLGHKASSPNNFNMQFPMYTNFITHVYNVTLNTSMHQYNAILCNIQSATHWTQEFRQISYLHDIYRFFPPYHTLQDDMQLKGEHTLQQHCRQSIIKTQQTTN